MDTLLLCEQFLLDAISIALKYNTPFFLFKKETLLWNHLVGFLCLIAAIFYIFKKKMHLCLFSLST